MKFNLYFGRSDGSWLPSCDNPQDADWFINGCIPADERECMNVGDVYIDTEGDKWERIE